MPKILRARPVGNGQEERRIRKSAASRQSEKKIIPLKQIQHLKRKKPDELPEKEP